MKSKAWNTVSRFALRVLILPLAVGSGAALTRGALAQQPAELVLLNGKIVTADSGFSIQQAVAIRDGKFLAVGGNDAIRRLAGPGTKTVDLNGRTVLPGLIDSHFHGIRSARTWDQELHWEEIRSLKEGLQMIADQTRRVPPGTWIRVVGGWHEVQLAEKRMPTVTELDQVAPEHPVWMQRLYERAIVNSAGLKALAITADAQDPPRGKLLRDAADRPIGVLGFFGILNWYLKLPQPTLEQEIQSTRNFFRELNRVGLTAFGDVAGGGLRWPDHYRAVEALHQRRGLTVRISWYMQPNRPGQEVQAVREFIDSVKPGSGDDWLKPAGIGEQVTVGVFDGDAFTPTAPTFSPQALEDWKTIVRMVAESGWRFQAHATRDNSVRQLLPAIEEIKIPWPDRRIAFAHLEDATPETIQRLKAIGGGITVQDRMIYNGADVLKNMGAAVAHRAPPLTTMLRLGIPLGGGTDATRVAPYLPFYSIWWMITGKTLGGESIRRPAESLSREEALRLYTTGSAWFSFDEAKLGSIQPGKLADLIVLTADYLTVPEDQIKDLTSVLTIVGGRPVYAAAEFAALVQLLDRPVVIGPAQSPARDVAERREPRPVQLAEEIPRALDLLLERRLRQLEVPVEDAEEPQHPDGPASGVPQHFAARRVLHLCGDSQRLEPGGVDDGALIQPLHPHRMLGSDLIQLADGGHAFFGELDLVPAAHDANPGSRRHATGLVRDHLESLFQGPDLLPVQLLVPGARRADAVEVRVDQTGQDRAAVEIDRLGAGAGEPADRVVAAYGEEFSVAYCDGLFDREAAVGSYDLAV